MLCSPMVRVYSRGQTLIDLVERDGYAAGSPGIISDTLG